jgi:hypothetical protein
MSDGRPSAIILFFAVSDLWQYAGNADDDQRQVLVVTQAMKKRAPDMRALKNPSS